jgi:arylsulfatase A-like enzyme
MVARWPGRIAPGSRTDRLVQTHDLAHTYVAAAGAKAMPYADGASLMPLFAGGAAAWRDDILCAYYGGEYLYTQRIGITQRFKYVFNGFDFDELYDLERDPGEMRNVVEAAEYTPQTNDMRARMYEMMARYRDPYGDNPAEGRADRYCAARYLPRGKRA